MAKELKAGQTLEVSAGGVYLVSDADAWWQDELAAHGRMFDLGGGRWELRANKSLQLLGEVDEPIVQFMPGRYIEPGYYWIDTSTEDYLEAYDYLRFAGFSVARTSESDGRVFAVVEVPEPELLPKAWLPRGLEMLTGKFTVAAKGPDTAFSDVMQSPDVPSPWERWDEFSHRASQVGSVLIAGSLLGSLAIYLFSRRK